MVFCNALVYSSKFVYEHVEREIAHTSCVMACLIAANIDINGSFLYHFSRHTFELQCSVLN